MSRYERYGTRDLTYSAWHRTLPDVVTMIDIDGLEYCRRCRAPLALIETARDVGQSFKSTIVLRELACRAFIPAFLVLYHIGEESGGIDQFRWCQIWPQRTDLATATVAEWSHHLVALHDSHRCQNSQETAS